MEGHDVKDEFKGFGDGFEGFPKRLPEDSVEYFLYVIDVTLKSQRDTLARLEAIRKHALKSTDDLLKRYIWQRESFDLNLENEKTLIYLHGLTNYGDSVEDEWLMVYILRELSKEFPDLWIKVSDTDGEFLLIEAANALPRWLNPEIADNRVWINKGALRIITLSAASPSSSNRSTAPISRTLSLEEALKTISSAPETLIRSPMIEEEAFYRLRNYPSQIEDSMHHARITIPRKLVYVLHELPGSIAPAVEAFYLRDPVSLKPLQSSPSDLKFPPTDLVTISVRFTKVLYAQVKSQQFPPPPAWKKVLSSAGNAAIKAQETKPSYDLGAKVTSGFEMLVTDSKNGDDRRVREINILLEDLASGDAKLPGDTEISTWRYLDKEDDDKWMDINFEDFEQELEGKGSKRNKAATSGVFGPEPPPAFGDAKTQADLKKMVERFEAFLNDDDAGVDGAEIDEMDVDDDEDSEEDSEDEDKEVSFDEKEFAKMMREMMGMPWEEGDEPPPAKTTKADHGKDKSRIEEVDTDDEDGSEEEASQIRQVMEMMEAELNDAGALNLDPTPTKPSALREISKGKQNQFKTEQSEEESEDESDEDLNIDFNLAKNLLESFKSQSGMAGPGGNLLGMMGMQLPRDEDDPQTSTKKN